LNIFIESNLQEYFDISKHYIKRILVAIHNNINNSKKFLNLKEIFNIKFREELLSIFEKNKYPDGYFVFELFEVLIQRISLKYELNKNIRFKFDDKFEPSYKM